MSLEDAFREAPPPPGSGAFDLWLPPDAVIAAMAKDGEPVPTGWSPLDSQLRGGGITPGRVVAVGGPPFTGKTTVVASMALHMSQKLNVFCLFADEGRAQAAVRMGVMLGVSLEDLEKDPQNASRRVGDALGERSIELLKPDRDDCSVDAVAAYARAKVPRGTTAVLVYDSIQTIPVNGAAREEDERINIKKFMARCRKVADETRFIILATSWAPRAAYRYKRQDQNTQRIAGFSGGAAIEYGADVAIYLDRTSARKVTEMDIVKNRLGRFVGPESEPIALQYDPASGQMLPVDLPTMAQDREAKKAEQHEKTVSKIADLVEQKVRKRGPMTIRQLRDAVAGKTTNIHEAVLGLEARGVLEPHATPRGGTIWQLRG